MQGAVVSKPFSLNGGQVENIKQVYELLTASELKYRTTHLVDTIILS